MSNLLEKIRVVKEKIEDKALKVMVELQTEAMMPPSKEDKIAYTISAVIGSLGYGTGCAFADTGLFDQAESILKTYYGNFARLTTYVAALLAVIAILLAMTSPKEKGASFAWSWLKRIFGCWILIQIMGGLFALGKELTAGQEFVVE